MDYLLIILAFLIATIAQMYLSVNYNKYLKIPASKGKTGFEVAREILDKHGLEKIYITETSGTLSDHYDPTRKVIRLSKNIFHGSSIASVSVAAHEVGHAIQHKEKYGLLKIRDNLVPVANFSNKAGYLAILIGIFFSLYKIFWIGIGLEIILLIFHLVTLPVELDASNRAKQELLKNNLITKKELSGCSSMLKAAALTYVSAVVGILIEVIRYIYLFGRSDKN